MTCQSGGKNNSFGFSSSIKASEPGGIPKCKPDNKNFFHMEHILNVPSARRLQYSAKKLEK